MRSRLFFPSHLIFTELPIAYSIQSISRSRASVICATIYPLRFQLSSKCDFEPKLITFTECVDLGPKSFKKFVSTSQLTLIELESDVFVLILDIQPSYKLLTLLPHFFFQSITTNVSLPSFHVR